MNSRMPNLVGHKYVLMVDDSPFVREVLARTVQEMGHCVTKAEDGIMGLKMALEQRPDVIILDVKMPGMDGIEVLDKLRADPQFEETLIVMLTSHGDGEIVKQALSRKANDYILKDDMDNMAGRLKKYLD